MRHDDPKGDVLGGEKKIYVNYTEICVNGNTEIKPRSLIKLV